MIISNNILGGIMSYCPECKYEFEEDVKICPDCKTELIGKVEELHEVDSKWVSLVKLNSSIMADMLKEALEENGVTCLEKSDMLHSAFAIESTSIAGGNLEILVSSEHIEKAKNILEQLSSKIEE